MVWKCIAAGCSLTQVRIITESLKSYLNGFGVIVLAMDVVECGGGHTHRVKLSCYDHYYVTQL